MLALHVFRAPMVFYMSIEANFCQEGLLTIEWHISSLQAHKEQDSGSAHHFFCPHRPPQTNFR